jgi:hypothetical protein
MWRAAHRKLGYQRKTFWWRAGRPRPAGRAGRPSLNCLTHHVVIALAFCLFSSRVRSYIITGKGQGTRTNLSVKIRLAVCLFLATVPLWARSHSHPAKPENISDPGYLYALAAANRFLCAWQTADLESGMVLLSDRVRRSQNADSLEQFFSNATSRAFEIERGRRHHGRYSFPVVLVTATGSHVTRRSSEIILVDAGKNDWVVDKLP